MIGTKRYAAAGLADLLSDDNSSVDSIISRGDYLSDSDDRHSNSFTQSDNENDFNNTSSKSPMSATCSSCGKTKCSSWYVNKIHLILYTSDNMLCATYIICTLFYLSGIPDWSFAKVGSLLLLPL